MNLYNWLPGVIAFLFVMAFEGWRNYRINSFHHLGVDRLRVLDLKPDEILIAETDAVLSQDQAYQIREHLLWLLTSPKSPRIFVIGNGVRIKKARRRTHAVIER